MNYYNVYGLKEYARKLYRQIGAGDAIWILPELAFESGGHQADACTECGECEEKCPQKIKIMERLKEAHKVLG
jgi:predicted aldo/keto reductase-like oxidoreductase